MKIPAKYQVFDAPVTIDDKDAERLRPLLSGYHTLYRNALRETANRPDLERLIVMELVGRKRIALINRMLMRLGRIHSGEIRDRIKKVLSVSSTNKRNQNVPSSSKDPGTPR